jgi:uncharacterized lipoprotein YmbA
MTAMRARRVALEALAVGALLFAAAGCGGQGAPSRFYVLAPLAGPPGSGTPAAADSAPVTIGVGPVRLPAYLDRPQVVTRLDPDRIDFGEFDRWGEPLADGVPRALAGTIGGLLPKSRIALFPWTGPRAIQYQVIVDVARFDGSLGGDVVLEARWRIVGADRKDLREGRFAASEPTGGQGYPAIVSAMSRSLGALGREIAAALAAI